MIEPEFNDALNNGSSSKLCTIIPVKYRLYPTYRIFASSYQACGISSSFEEEEWTDENDDLDRSKLGRKGTDFDPKVGRKSPLFLLNIRFPVIRSLRTHDDTYATLVCSPDDDREVVEEVENDIGHQGERSDRSGSRAATTNLPLSIERDDLDEPSVEESRRRQVLTLANQSLSSVFSRDGYQTTTSLPFVGRVTLTTAASIQSVQATHRSHEVARATMLTTTREPSPTTVQTFKTSPTFLPTRPSAAVSNEPSRDQQMDSVKRDRDLPFIGGLLHEHVTKCKNTTPSIRMMAKPSSHDSQLGLFVLTSILFLLMITLMFTIMAYNLFEGA